MYWYFLTAIVHGAAFMILTALTLVVVDMARYVFGGDNNGK